MPDRLSIHAPVLVNTLGHCAGAVAFGILLYLLVLDWRRDRHERSVLPSIAAGLALFWNLGSLIGMATSPEGNAVADAIVAASFSVLSLLPAVLLHISVASRRPALWIAGYAVSGLAVALHIGDLITTAPRFHYAALLLVTIGFGALTTLSVVQEAVAGEKNGSGPRLAGAMVLFLLAISFVHFGSAHDTKAWSGEAALHHAGIPLALFVLLQDYRFLLLDAFIRFVVNAFLAALAVWAAFQVDVTFKLLARAAHDPFYAGLVFTGVGLLLSIFAWARNHAQRMLTRAVFFRPSREHVILKLREFATEASTEPEYLGAASKTIAEFFSARRFDVVAETGVDPEPANAVADPARRNLPLWVRAFTPLRFSRGDARLLLLGSRAGGRRYLSEDIEILERLASIVSEQIERIRNSEMQSLVSQAELRALQAQINPHFFFNALNTLYGTISRENSAARRLVSNLAGLFRYSFAASHGRIRIEEELSIIRAYLEIEQLRLGDKLRTEIDVDDSALRAEVPVLSIQPLVENAIRHGAASRPEGGFVRLCIRNYGERIMVEISNSGSFRETSPDRGGNGVGLANVRRRLALCYGDDSKLEVVSADNVTSVRFSLPGALLAGTAA
jgi:two-component system LytT family sensor kinase